MKKALLISLICIISFCGSAQTNYYVATTGNNSNAGSLALPWLTVQYGLNQLSTTDTLNVLTGVYNEKIQIPISGITLRNHISNSPILDATGLTTQDAIIEIYDVANVTINGFELQNNIMLDAQGILVAGNCQNVAIKNCVIHDIHFSSNPGDVATSSKNAQGIIVYGTNGASAITNLVITNNELYNCRLGYSEGIAVNGNVDGFEVSNNIVHDITNIGIDAIGHEGTSSTILTDQARNGLIKNNTVYNCISSYATSGGIYVDGAKDIVIENNTLYHNGYGIEIGCENIGKKTSNITTRNNIIYDNEVAALAFGGFDYPIGSGKVINSTFRNNSCFFNDYSTQGYGEMYLSYTENCVIENNIFYALSQNVMLYQDGIPLNLSINYNVYHSSNTGAGVEFGYSGNTYNGVSNFNIGTGHDNNSLETSPLFITPSISSPNFHLQASSPCINSGNPSYIPSAQEKDMDNETRNNGIIDCGADEHYPTTYIKTITENNLLQVYPNPTSNYIKTNLNGEYKILTTQGKLVIKGIVTNNIIYLEKFLKGIYILEMKNGNKHYTNQIVLK